MSWSLIKATALGIIMVTNGFHTKQACEKASWPKTVQTQCIQAKAGSPGYGTICGTTCKIYPL